MAEQSSELTRVLAVPSDRLWLDPRLVRLNLYTVANNVATDPATSVRLATNNPYRWAVGFVHDVYGGSVRVSPWVQDGISVAGWLLEENKVLWFNLTEHTSLVGDEWYASITSGSVVRVIEVIRNPKG